MYDFEIYAVNFIYENSLFAYTAISLIPIIPTQQVALIWGPPIKEYLKCYNMHNKRHRCTRLCMSIGNVILDNFCRKHVFVYPLIPTVETKN